MMFLLIIESLSQGLTILTAPVLLGIGSVTKMRTVIIRCMVCQNVVHYFHDKLNDNLVHPSLIPSIQQGY